MAYQNFRTGAGAAFPADFRALPPIWSPHSRPLAGHQDGSGVHFSNRLSLHEGNKVFVHLFQKVVDSKGNAFGRPPQRAEHLYRQALLGEFENLSARQAEPAPSSRCWLGVGLHPYALAARQAEPAPISRCWLGVSSQPYTLAAGQAQRSALLSTSKVPVGNFWQAQPA